MVQENTVDNYLSILARFNREFLPSYGEWRNCQFLYTTSSGQTPTYSEWRSIEKKKRESFWNPYSRFTTQESTPQDSTSQQTKKATGDSKQSRRGSKSATSK